MASGAGFGARACFSASALATPDFGAAAGAGACTPGVLAGPAGLPPAPSPGAAQGLSRSKPEKGAGAGFGEAPAWPGGGSWPFPGTWAREKSPDAIAAAKLAAQRRYGRINFDLEKRDARPPPASALACLITFLCPVDDVDSALASHQLVGAVALAQRFQRVADFHRRGPKKQPALGAGWKRSCDLCPIRRRRSTLKTNVRRADNEFWKGLSFIRPLPLARIML